MVAASHAAGIAGSDAAANEIRGCHRLPASGSHTAGIKRMVGAVGPAFLHMQDSEDIPPGLTVCQGGILDRDPLYLGCANGVVDLNAGRLLPPEEGRRQLISRNTGVSFDPEARDGSIDDLLTALLSEPESCHLLAALGHALRGGVRVAGTCCAGNPTAGSPLSCGPLPLLWELSNLGGMHFSRPIG